MSTSVFSPIHTRTCPDDSVLETLTSSPREDWGYEWCKRLLDLLGAGALLICVLPLLVAIGLGIKGTSPGPVLFRQVRLGRDGRRFWCYKFRTMVVDAESRLAACEALRGRFLENYKIENDPRVTRLGSFLRRTSLDELPQLWNVVRGDMSLIGPRPIIVPELVKYGRFGKKLLAVKPGLGGIWQVSGRSDTTYAERVQMDMDYIDNRSLRFDLSLVVRTAWAVLVGRGAR